jgi:hypothetical protein
MLRLRRHIAWIALAGFVSGQAGVWVSAHHSALGDDSACAAIDGPDLIGPHHEVGRQIEDAVPPAPSDHCPICHLQRAVSGARLALVSTATTAPRVMAATVERTTALALVVHPGLPSRGPPSRLT